ncbi:hypothetical protein [Streptomyces sp. NPDC001933]|uniref:hypothetical protein n=1 Tax=Streptomyces sp. NPDC001933 TaxID=3364626 RepID=UPI0036BE5670
MTSTRPDETLEALAGLRQLFLASGIYAPHVVVDDHTPADQPSMHMEGLSGNDAARLSELLRAVLDLPIADARPTEQSSSWYMPYEETVAVRDDLHQVLAVAGISGLTHVETHPRGGPPFMHLNHLAVSDIARLSSLLSEALREHFATADALLAAFRAHNLDADRTLPVPAVGDLSLFLGDVSVHTALALGTLLGAPPLFTKLADFPDYPESIAVMDRLHEAVKNTAFGFMDVQLHPNCMKCGHAPSITLGALELGTAQRLVAALQSARVTAQRDAT